MGRSCIAVSRVCPKALLYKGPWSKGPNWKGPILETDAKKIDWLKNWQLVKNPYFFSNQADSQATLPTHELIILTMFHKDWQKIEDFLVIVKI